MSLEALARRLYDDCPTPKPAWPDLGDATRGVWLESAMRKLTGDPRWWSVMPLPAEPATSQQQELFA